VLNCNDKYFSVLYLYLYTLCNKVFFPLRGGYAITGPLMISALTDISVLYMVPKCIVDLIENILANINKTRNNHVANKI